MKRLFQTITFVVFALVGGYATFAQNSTNCIQSNLLDYDKSQTLTVEANVLLKEPKCYDNRFIRTFGFYRYGFEYSHLFCLECENSDSTWIEMRNFDAAIKRCTSSKNLKKLDSPDGKTLGIVVLGIFKTKLNFVNQNSSNENSEQMNEPMTENGYGLRNAYDSEFSPICFEQVEVLSDNYLVPATADKKTIKRMKEWYKKMSEKYGKSSI